MLKTIQQTADYLNYTIYFYHLINQIVFFFRLVCVHSGEITTASKETEVAEIENVLKQHNDKLKYVFKFYLKCLLLVF